MFATALWVIGVVFWIYVILGAGALIIGFLCTRAGQVTVALVLGGLLLLVLR